MHLVQKISSISRAQSPQTNVFSIRFPHHHHRIEGKFPFHIMTSVIAYQGGQFFVCSHVENIHQRIDLKVVSFSWYMERCYFVHW